MKKSENQRVALSRLSISPEYMFSLDTVEKSTDVSQVERKNERKRKKRRNTDRRCNYPVTRQSFVGQGNRNDSKSIAKNKSLWTDQSCYSTEIGSLFSFSRVDLGRGFTGNEESLKLLWEHFDFSFSCFQRPVTKTLNFRVRIKTTVSYFNREHEIILVFPTLRNI